MRVLDCIKKSGVVPILAVFAIMSALGGCVTTVKDMPASTFNPPPASSLSAFRQIELIPIRHDLDVQMNEANQRALQKIQENIDVKIGRILKQWNTSPSSASSGQLVIEPTITELKFVSGGTRFFAGALAGNSAVVMRVKIYEKESGEVIAHPEFYQRAVAIGGAWSLGTTDNNMLKRIADLFTDYLEDNYDQPVGGRTGVVEPEL